MIYVFSWVRVSLGAFSGLLPASQARSRNDGKSISLVNKAIIVITVFFAFLCLLLKFKIKYYIKFRRIKRCENVDGG
jgi:hypothetical protein